MRISTKGRYALRLMLDLAMSGSDDYISLRDVAQRQDVSMKYMEQIVSQLTKAGYLRSVRGPQGGYKLAREAESYTVGDILRVTEGKLAPVTCLDTEENQCPRAAICPTLPFWQGLYDCVNGYLNSAKLSDLLVDAPPSSEWGSCST